jgi:hypothetical protein
VGAGPCVDARGTCPAGEGVGRVTDISALARLTVASAASGAKRRESAARGVRHGELCPEPLMNTESKPLRGVRGGSRAPPVQPHGVKRGYRPRRQHGATKRRPRARSRGRDACRAFSLGVRLTRLRAAQGIGTAPLSCPAVGPWKRGDAELTEWPPALGPRFALASEDVPGLPETRETLDAREAEAGG